MYTHLDQNITSDLLTKGTASEFYKQLKQKQLVISFVTIAELYQRSIISNIKNELQILEELNVGYLIQESNTKAKFHKSAQLLEKFDDWMETTINIFEIKDATFAYQHAISNDFKKEEVLNVIDETLSIYCQDKYKDVEGIEYHIQDVENFKKLILDNEIPPFNPIQHLRSQLGTEPAVISSIPPKKIFDYLKDLFLKSKEGKEYFEGLIKNLNDKKSVCSQIDFLNLELVVIGYHADKFKKNKIRGLINDSSHLAMACFCDEFLTNDYKLSQRAKAIYHFLNWKTKVQDFKVES